MNLNAPDRRHTFRPASRVRRAAEFDALMKQGARLADGLMAVWARPNGLGHARLGLVVGRRHGNAPTRNALKRKIREAFRGVQHELPRGIDLAVMPHAGGELTLRATTQSLVTLAQRLAQRIERGRG